MVTHTNPRLSFFAEPNMILFIAATKWMSCYSPLLQVNMASDATVEQCQLLTFILLFRDHVYTSRQARNVKESFDPMEIKNQSF